MFKTLSAKAATALDQELMSTGAFSIDQLMELAGLSVAQAVYSQYPPTSTNDKILVVVGPGNNGGDGLVAARHLKLWKGYDPVIYYPKKTTKTNLYTNLVTQLTQLEVPQIDDLSQVKRLISGGGVKLILDSLFGFSFKPPIREPFGDLIRFLSAEHQKIPPIVSIDIPSGWDVDAGPLSDETNIKPTMLISLTAPKPCSVNCDMVHYLGGRFINNEIAEKYGIRELIERYEGNEMIVKL